jgi:hypothetical protein
MTIFLADAESHERRRAFSTQLREATYRQLKLQSAATGRRVQELVEEALTDYLNKGTSSTTWPQS